MASLILKPECLFFTMQEETLFTSSSGLGNAMLQLNRITGACLTAIGVMVLFANVLLGCAVLLIGPDSTIQLLGQ